MAIEKNAGSNTPLLSPASFRAIVSGQRRTPAAALSRALLRAAEIPYAWAMRRRNAAYDSGRQPTIAAAVPVVSVGNLTLGGTGKTPLVEWIARWFRGQGVRVAIVSRGYGSREQQSNDEARELAAKLPDVPHVQNADRVAAAARAVAEFGCQLIVLDDGFQHRRLRRDLDVVLIDGLEPFGFDHIFPRGTLREPLAGLRRADAVVLSRADMVDAEERAAIRRRVLEVAPEAAWAEAIHAPRRLLSANGDSAPLATFADKPVAAFCGIGNPAGFRHTLAGCGYKVVAWREYADHHHFSNSDIKDLACWADAAPCDAVLCTHKDLVKLQIPQIGARPLWALEVALEFTAGEQEVIGRLGPLAEKSRHSA